MLPGGYLEIEGAPEMSGKVAEIISEEISTDVYGYCFIFYFTMTGSPEADLNVTIVTRENSTTLWRMMGEYSKDWTYAQVYSSQILIHKYLSIDLTF